MYETYLKLNLSFKLFYFNKSKKSFIKLMESSGKLFEISNNYLRVYFSMIKVIYLALIQFTTFYEY